jgi:hypothetical protein
MPLTSVRRLAMAVTAVVIAAVLIVLFVASFWSSNGGTARQGGKPGWGPSNPSAVVVAARPFGRKWG